ncbi:MAG: amidohydrolase [Clostridia bacterium]|nr:amidohydrolase [Clostridia bacterium]
MLSVDTAYVTRVRRELHRVPELEFDLPKTVAIVKQELTALNIPYTEKFGTGSVVGTIGPADAKYCIAIRADMDALPVQEQNDVPYRSTHTGLMHACGHDTHTAMLLAAAKLLKEQETALTCRVKLLFQPSEEGRVSGASMMIQNGVLDDVDIVIGQHVDPALDVGTAGICIGPAMASSHNYKLEFFGKTAHATLPHTGADALAAAITAYQAIHTMLNREIDPFTRYVCSINKLNAGTTQNVVPDHAVMLGTLRTYDMDVDRFIMHRIKEICANAANGTNVTFKCEDSTKATVVNNDPALCEAWMCTARAVLGDDNVTVIAPQMASEDFSRFQDVRPGILFRTGTRNAEKGLTALLHNPDFDIDEKALPIGAALLVQFVLDQQAKQ